MVALAGILAFVASPCWGGKPEKEENEGRLSPASLDVDTCGCPTTFGDPECEERTEWTLDKTTRDCPGVEEDCIQVFNIEGTVSCDCKAPHDALEDALDPFNPPEGSANLVVAHPGGDSYFNATLTNADAFKGTYDSWCVDTDNNISPGATYCVELVSTYSALAQQLVEHPENLDLVNWIINQGVVGDPSACGGTYTYGDIQRTIWALIEDQQSGSGLGPWTQCRVDEIIAAAQANGEDFVPGCDEFVAVIQNPERPAFIIWGFNLAIDMLNCQKKERSTWKPS